jgi:hypothetical protein
MVEMKICENEICTQRMQIYTKKRKETRAKNENKDKE